MRVSTGTYPTLKTDLFGDGTGDSLGFFTGPVYVCENVLIIGVGTCYNSSRICRIELS